MQRMMKFVDHQKKYVLEKEQKGIIVLISSDADFEDDLQAAADAGIEVSNKLPSGPLLPTKLLSAVQFVCNKISIEQ